MAYFSDDTRAEIREYLFIEDLQHLPQSRTDEIVKRYGRTPQELIEYHQTGRTSNSMTEALDRALALEDESRTKLEDDKREVRNDVYRDQLETLRSSASSRQTQPNLPTGPTDFQNRPRTVLGAVPTRTRDDDDEQQNGTSQYVTPGRTNRRLATSPTNFQSRPRTLLSRNTSSSSTNTSLTPAQQVAIRQTAAQYTRGVAPRKLLKSY